MAQKGQTQTKKKTQLKKRKHKLKKRKHKLKKALSLGTWMWCFNLSECHTTLYPRSCPGPDISRINISLSSWSSICAPRLLRPLSRSRRFKVERLIGIPWRFFGKSRMTWLRKRRSTSCVQPQMIPNDPQTGNDPQLGPQMIPDVDRKWSRRKGTNGMEFGLPDFFILFLYLFINSDNTKLENNTKLQNPRPARPH